MSNKNQKHPTCACANAPSAVASGLVIPLVKDYQPKVARRIKLEECRRKAALQDGLAYTWRNIAHNMLNIHAHRAMATPVVPLPICKMQLRTTNYAQEEEGEGSE